MTTETDPFAGKVDLAREETIDALMKIGVPLGIAAIAVTYARAPEPSAETIWGPQVTGILRAYVARIDGEAAKVSARVDDGSLDKETVLRAMIRVYGDAETDARIAHHRQAQFRAAAMHTYRDEIICEFVEVANGFPGPAFSIPVLQKDYEARLVGTRPLDAPPMEAP